MDTTSNPPPATPAETTNTGNSPDGLLADYPTARVCADCSAFFLPEHSPSRATCQPCHHARTAEHDLTGRTAPGGEAA